MMATVCHVTSSSGLRKFQPDGFLFDRMYMCSRITDAVLYKLKLFCLFDVKYTLNYI